MKPRSADSSKTYEASATPRFWQQYGSLPNDIRELADKNFKLLKGNPSHPSLRFKKIGNLWSARVGLAHRALAIQDGDDFMWVWIGTHDEHEKMIRGR